MILQIIKSFLVILVGILVPIHDAPIAMFKLIDKGDFIGLHITLDAADLSQSSEISEAAIDLDYLKKYLKQHVEFMLDGQSITYDLLSFNQNLDHIHISGKIEASIMERSHVKIKNSCLLNIDNQSNIVQLKYADQLRDFRMTKDRQEITVSL